MGWGLGARLVLRHIHRGESRWRQSVSILCVVGAALALLLVAVFGVGPALGVHAAPDWSVPPSASCQALAGLDATATNGGSWGRTILAGHGAAGGWFGVDVCDNGLNASAPNGANVSCDRIPDNWAKTGCAPGRATSDGYGLTFQCVELIIRFSAWAYGDPVSAWGRSGYGNAPDLWLPQNHPSDFVMYPNGSSTAPVPGDILVWGNVDSRGQPLPAGADGQHGGHIAVVAAVHNGTVITAEQNVKWGTQDHPSDTLALTKVGAGWVLSGSMQHQTRLPTYRWQQTMGNTRATYGWLHSIKNHGALPTSKTPTATARPTAPAKPAAPTQMSGGLPSLAAGVSVTNDGTLTDLVWSQTSPFSAVGAASAPQAELRSLGTPPNTHLAAGQTPAVVPLTDGSRDVYVLGADGHLYVAHTAPELLGVWWSDLGAPGAVRLTGSASASAYAGGVAVAAVGADGNLWWRAGPVAAPGDWQLIGHPDAAALAGSFALAGAPGSGSPLLLALGVDGRLFERIWQAATDGGDGSVQVPAGWSQWIVVHSQPAGVQLTGNLVVVPEIVKPTAWVGSWPDTPLDVLMSDSAGRLWWLRSTAFASGWVLNTIPVAAPISTLMAAVEISPQPAATPASATPTQQPTSSLATPGSLALFAMAAKAPYEAQVAIPAQPRDLPAAPTWTKLSALPAVVSAGAPAVALPLGAGATVALLPRSDGVIAGGASASTSLLRSYDSATITPSGAGTNPWTALGVVTSSSSFSDPLTSTSLNREWRSIGTNATATENATGLRLVPGASSMAALLQGAMPGDATISARVSLPGSSSGATAGLLLYLDGGDWLTLAVAPGNHVAFCVETRATALPCVTKSAVLPATAHAVYLRVTRQAATYTSSYSADGQSWIDVGQWTAGVATNRSAASATTPTTTPAAIAPTPTLSGLPAATPTTSAANPSREDSGAAPLSFTEAGLFVTSATGALDLPVFSEFAVNSLVAAP